MRISYDEEDKGRKVREGGTAGKARNSHKDPKKKSCFSSSLILSFPSSSLPVKKEG